MRCRRVDVYAMQETWLGGSCTLSNKGCTIIYRNEDDVCRRGVGIVLSARGTAAWDAAGRKLAVRGAKASARACATLAIIKVRGPLPQPPSQEPCSLLLPRPPATDNSN